MTTFANAARKEANYTYTENMAVALKSTQSPLLDLFSVVGAMRLKSYSEVAMAFKGALSEDKLLATKIMFYARNIRGGLGERDTFRKMLDYLAKNDPKVVIKNMEWIPFFGRWDDLYVLVGTPAENEMWAFMAKTIMFDIEKMKAGKSISLCAKWLKSVNTSSKKSVELAKLTAKQFGMSEKQYRKTLSSLREYIKVTERYMSAGEWDEIAYSAVPSHAMKNYRKAFGKHDPEGFGQFITKVTKGEETIKSATLYPYDILVAANLTYGGRGGAGWNGWNRTGNGNFTIDSDPVLEAQWKALPNYIKKAMNWLVMCDTSASMNGLPMAIAISLGIYSAERNTGAYKDLLMTFSERPEFVHLKGDTLKEKVECVPSIVANTDLEAGFDLILDVAKKNNVPQEEMPRALVVVSDMQFDAATGTDLYGIRPGKKQTFHESMKAKYEAAGYEMPQIIYWQVQARQDALQATKDDRNVMLVSGASASTFKSVIDNIGATPYESMLQILNDPQYEMITV